MMPTINPKVKVKEHRFWTRTTMMFFLINNDWVKQHKGYLYDNLFCFVEHNKPTNKNIYAVAKYIVDNFIEEEDKTNELETVERIMAKVFRKAVMFYYEVERGE